MNHIKNFIFITAGVLFVGGCSSTRVMVDFDEAIDFSVYKTYYVVKPKHENMQEKRSQIHDSLFNKEVVREIRPVMEAKGFQEAIGIEDADLLIHFYSFTKNRKNYIPASYHVGRHGHIRHLRPGHVVKYKEGTLVIDIVDAKEKELVWKGVGKDVLNPHDPGENLVAAVEKILTQFPPK